MPDDDAPSDSIRAASELSSSGIGLAVGAYLIWGLTPIYWKLLESVAAAELLIPRIAWTLVLMLVVTRLVGRQEETWAGGARGWLPTVAAAGLLGTNWGLFIYAVQSDQILATSLGYYINPLLSVLLGMLILGERLGRAQALAIALAAAGVAIMTVRGGALPWVSLALAGSFGLYGLIHKLAPQPPLAGLTREMLALAPPALAALGLLAASGGSTLVHAPLRMQLLLVLSGAVTAAPLLLFHAAARRLPLVAVGMFQYIAPTIALLLAVAIYEESFTSTHAMGFGCVWLGLGIFTSDSLRRASGARQRMRNSDAAALPMQENPSSATAAGASTADAE